MPNGEGTFIKLLIIGAFIGLGRMLSDNAEITLKLALGRMFLGSAVSLMAGLLLIQFPDIHELALVGAASALGILGHTVVEAYLKRWLNSKVKGTDNETK